MGGRGRRLLTSRKREMGLLDLSSLRFCLGVCTAKRRFRIWQKEDNDIQSMIRPMLGKRDFRHEDGRTVPRPWMLCRCR